MLDALTNVPFIREMLEPASISTEINFVALKHHAAMFGVLAYAMGEMCVYPGDKSAVHTYYRVFKFMNLEIFRGSPQRRQFSRQQESVLADGCGESMIWVM